MRLPKMSRSGTLRTVIMALRAITASLGGLMAFGLLLLGIINLINPDVSDEYLALNTRVCITMIVTGVVLIYAIFLPFSGGILLGICAVAFGLISGVFLNPITIAELPLAVLFVISGLLWRRIFPKEPEQTS
ncbi:MAG: hypothetical protein JSU77_11240 [Fidelibacterota bacterium]|nr:MAG: hypothetical protein JSU77_11240 [Candidatus Neomarinimicrobiota bacterium]